MNIQIWILFTNLVALNNLCGVITSNDSNVQNFLIRTAGCKIPTFPVMSSTINKLIHEKPLKCTEITNLLGNNSTHIWVIEEALDLYNVFNKNDFYCCYRYFHVENTISQISYGPCEEFSNVIEAKHEFTRVECYYLDAKIHDDFILFPKFIKGMVSNNVTNSKPKFNVLLFGIESMSRMNFLRMMPKTSKFLQGKGSIQLLGYNKVGDNSFPNLFPLLFGKSYEEIKKFYIRDNTIDLTKCIIIWDYFKEAGYLTALASDSIAGLLGTYEYSFSKIPTDFYLQPFIFETRNIFNNKQYNFHQCLRNKYFYNLLLNWTIELLWKSSSSNNKLFGIFWEESLSHEDFNVPREMDEGYFNLLKNLEESKRFDDSIVILFSDHGTRWGTMAQTEEGHLENRLPLFDIILPKEFQTRYPMAFKNLKKNRYRLTSPFDIHETLLDIARNNLEGKEINKRRKGLNKNSLGLFLPVSKQRTCKAMRISEHWCACQKHETVLKEETKKLYIANFMINYINRLIKDHIQCLRLRVQKILNATVSIDKHDQVITYKIVLLTTPGAGIFEGTLHDERQKLSVSGIITRLNLYRYTSQCIKDDKLKMYCTCK